MRSLPILLLTSLLFSPITFADKGANVVKQFVDAFNQHDIDAMLALATADLQWMSIAGDQISVETSSHSELREAMSGYFKSTPTAHSKIRSMNASGHFVYTVEEAFWGTGGNIKSQCSMAVYEFSGSKIRNVWYFPEHQCQ